MISTWNNRFMTRSSPLIDPATLFVGSDKGAWYDPNDLTKVWQDTAGTLPGAVGSPVARLDAKAGTFTPLLQATGASQPILRLDAVTGYHYLDFDGTDDSLASAGQTFNAVDTMTVMAGVITKNGSGNTSRIMGYGGTTQNGTFGLTCAGTATWTPTAWARGTAAATASGSDTLPGPDKLVLCGQADVSADTVTLRQNGTQIAASAVDQGTGNWTSRSSLVGYAGGGSGLNAYWYGGLQIDRVINDTERANMEAVLAARIGN